MGLLSGESKFDSQPPQARSCGQGSLSSLQRLLTFPPTRMPTHIDSDCFRSRCLCISRIFVLHSEIPIPCSATNQGALPNHNDAHTNRPRCMCGTDRHQWPFLVGVGCAWASEKPQFSLGRWSARVLCGWPLGHFFFTAAAVRLLMARGGWLGLGTAKLAVLGRHISGGIFFF